jgi:hypothetical protein
MNVFEVIAAFVIIYLLVCLVLRMNQIIIILMAKQSHPTMRSYVAYPDPKPQTAQEHDKPHPQTAHHHNKKYRSHSTHKAKHGGHHEG